ncbi:lipocalin family protein [Salinimicrobium sp. MT39]|uniref:Lipocalin family protein n=1 Tax=Salinimicrobium profundisediminis TaxID=2994553 RepID=A0A9X3D0I7_9FLAO|nr:lipocalin family protein [Salinimicrobium profundisediminis]MCX2839019.1 lipocalin family protein [Salinimicrobium profundisediminis]
MKKYLFLLAAFTLIFFSSCSSDDDNGGEADPIIGTWTLVEASLFDVEGCTEQSFVTLKKGNTGSATFYLQQADCTPQSSSGEWENLGDSRYKLAVPVIGAVEGTVVFTGDDSFTFQTASTGSFTFEKQ